jgi:hypothetical protein
LSIETSVTAADLKQSDSRNEPRCIVGYAVFTTLKWFSRDIDSAISRLDEYGINSKQRFLTSNSLQKLSSFKNVSSQPTIGLPLLLTSFLRAFTSEPLTRLQDLIHDAQFFTWTREKFATNWLRITLPVTN